MATPFSIIQAQVRDVDDVAPMFDAYRQFYGQAPDLALARKFLTERISADQSIVLIARSESGVAIGFVQMYPLFSSVAAAPIYLLNDLYVCENARRTGVSQALLKAAAYAARRAGAIRLMLTTAHTNRAAQAAYLKAGWSLDLMFRTYLIDL